MARAASQAGDGAGSPVRPGQPVRQEMAQAMGSPSVWAEFAVSFITTAEKLDLLINDLSYRDTNGQGTTTEDDDSNPCLE
ncbi:hypothetical protein IEQ34_010647 [Dendrobium chrysotoxum]|uniref:Uncharacterized protein n=1 Tax=Dendrobium chrysotoxum TaxID=161865 RepID=A0AAV7GW20_DENCH|nr:hypothetical protein IEQ34_010647 [Dendrobium chrysotoxum]